MSRLARDFLLFTVNSCARIVSFVNMRVSRVDQVTVSFIHPWFSSLASLVVALFLLLPVVPVVALLVADDNVGPLHRT